MVKRILEWEKQFSIGKATLIIGSLGLLSRFLGLFRDRLFASTFGAGDVLDIYYTAFRIPDFVYNLLILGTLSAAFVPIFAGLRNKDKDHAAVVVSTVTNLTVIGIGIVCVIIYIFCKPLTALVVPGFDADKLASTIALTRVLLLSPILFTFSNVLSSVLISSKQFLIVNIAPLFYNLGIIGGIVFLYPRYGLKGLGYGVLIGAVMHLLIQLPIAFKHGFTWRPILKISDPAIKKITKLFIPRLFSLDSSYISLIIASMIGSILTSGSIAIFNLANNLQAVPLGVFALSTAVAAFPALSESFAHKNTSEFNRLLSQSIRQILFFIIPISIIMLIFRAYIVRIILGSGNFDWEDTILTFQTLGVFTFALISQSLLPLLARAFYARHNTIIPTVTSLVSLGFNATLSYLLAEQYGIIGVAIGFTVANSLNCLLLFILLRFDISKDWEIPNTFDKEILTSVIKIITASVLMGLTGYILLQIVGPLVNTHTLIGIAIQASTAGLGALGIYAVLAYAFGLPEAKYSLNYIFKLFAKK